MEQIKVVYENWTGDSYQGKSITPKQILKLSDAKKKWTPAETKLANERGNFRVENVDNSFYEVRYHKVSWVASGKDNLLFLAKNKQLKLVRIEMTPKMADAFLQSVTTMSNKVFEGEFGFKRINGVVTLIAKNSPYWKQ